HSEIVIPVSCVERGRWRWSSREFRTSDRAIYAKLRKRKTEQVSNCLRSSGGRSADQSDIWSDIASKSAHMHAYSETGAASAIFEDNAAALDHVVNMVRARPGQTGAAFLVNGIFAGIEIFGMSATLKKLFPKIVRSYALDAIEADSQPTLTVTDAVTLTARKLQDAFSARTEKHFAIGLGEDIRLNGCGMVGAALTLQDRLVHLCAYSRSYD
ncbi:MAG: hypothetical protein RJB58_1514, partial [Pseudomonadota bacterium]